MSVREYLSENFLDDNFVKLMSIVYNTQLILGSSCVVMSGKLVSTISLYQKIYSILWIIAVSWSFYCFVLLYYYSYYNKEITLFYTFAFGLLLQYVSYILNIYRARFSKSKETVTVFLKIQKLDRDLKKNNLSDLFPDRFLLNRLWIGYTISNFIIGFTVFVYSHIKTPLYTIPMGCAILSLYLELVLSGSCFYYLARRLRHLNYIIRKLIAKRKRKNDIIKIEVLGYNFRQDHKTISLKELTKIITTILKLFHETSNLFTFEIFNLVVTMLIWVFLVIESTVIGMRSKLVPILASTILVGWILFHFIQLVTTAFSCDWFAKQVRDTKRLAVEALSISYEDKDADIRKVSWELLQLIEFEQPIFSVYGIFSLNTRLPLKLIGVITTNVLVLIQYTSNALNTN